MMNTSKTIVGVDIAKRVFQLYWVEGDTGEEMNVRLGRTKFLRHFANRYKELVQRDVNLTGIRLLTDIEELPPGC